ncbi:alpha/beta fold hydrolase [Actinomycetospora sp. NBRC 106378]|uniref:alpha/beta hydrolase family protein n=1 Tax=Actinomycetospora sp. NBRC 106378 TaxID=3032208 RepID=UPI0024A3831E|nr:alpha/beta fold hydrolase [Actinomycetospora sp. NBRC 106378]GLZ52154.1 hypothetical protein Acsp07_17710 [Actinomycetospora sp. NBRC 106378]
MDVTTADGATFVVRLTEAADPAAPVVVVLPAMAMKAKFYRPLAAALHAEGLAAATCDLRGHGESTPALAPGARHGYREMIETDLTAVLDALHDRLPDAPVVLLGHSLGGQVALLHTAWRPERVAGLVLVAVGTVHWWRFRTLRRRLEVLGQVQWMALRSRLAGWWPGGVVVPLPVSGPVVRDWARHCLTGRYRPAGSRVAYDRALALLDRPVLSISLVDDPLGPTETVDALGWRLRAASVTRRHLGPDDGVAEPGHFGWIASAPAVAAEVARWISAARTATPA